MFTPDSGEKTAKPSSVPTAKHVTMKCGWICVECRAVAFKLRGLQTTPCCRGGLLHKKVLCAAYMCQNCSRLANDLSSIKDEACPCSFKGDPDPAAAATTETRSDGGLKIRSCARAGTLGGPYMEVPVIAACKEPVKAAPAEPPNEPKQAPAACNKATAAEEGVQAAGEAPQAPKHAAREKVSAAELPEIAASACDLEAKPHKPRPSAKKQLWLPIPARNSPNTSEDKPGSVVAAIEAAQQQLSKLLILKALDTERAKLEDLLLKKAQEQQKHSHQQQQKRDQQKQPCEITVCIWTNFRVVDVVWPRM